MKTVPELNTLHSIEQSYYPGQKNWDNHAHARDLSSMHAPMFGLRGCLNFFGQGSSYTSTYRKNASTESLAKNNDVRPNILVISSQPPREKEREREGEREREDSLEQQEASFVESAERVHKFMKTTHLWEWVELHLLSCSAETCLDLIINEQHLVKTRKKIL